MPDYSKTRIQFRRGTAAELAAANPVLGQGEPAFATDTNSLKVGDGSTAYSSLSAISGGGGGGGGISNLVEDTTPQLGGELDINSQDITGTGNITVVGTGTFAEIVKSGGTSSQFLKADGSVDTSTYLTSFTETNDLSAAVTWVNVPDANITQSSVTQHQAALSITESQISDLQSYLTSETFTSLVQDTTPQLGGALDTNGSNITGTGSINISGDLTTTGNNVSIGSASYGLEVSSSAATLGSNRLQILSAETVMNQAGASVDFRVEGDTDTDLFFVDASTDRVGISTSTPDYLFQVENNTQDLAGFTRWYTTGPVGSGNIQNLVIQGFSGTGAKGIYLSHYCNESNGSETQTLKNVIRMGEGIISLDDAYTTGLSTSYNPKLQVNTETGAVTFNDTYTFPTADGSANQVLQTDGAGNLSFGTVSTTNLDTTNFSAATIVTEAEGIGSNDNDTTLPTSAAVKDYADTKVASDTSAVSNSTQVNNIVMITQTNYDALGSYDSNTLYFIT